MGGGKIKGIKWLFYFSFLLKMITFAVYFYPLLHRDGTVQILQNLLVRIIYHGIVQRIQVNKRSSFAAVSHPRTDDSNRYVVVACGGSPAVARYIEYKNKTQEKCNYCTIYQCISGFYKKNVELHLLLILAIDSLIYSFYVTILLCKKAPVFD